MVSKLRVATLSEEYTRVIKKNIPTGIASMALDSITKSMKAQTRSKAFKLYRIGKYT